MSDPRSIIREAEHGLICGDSELQKVLGIASDLISELDFKIRELKTQLSESEYFESVGYKKVLQLEEQLKETVPKAKIKEHLYESNTVSFWVSDSSAYKYLEKVLEKEL